MTGIVIIASILSYFNSIEAFMSNHDEKILFFVVNIVAILLGFGLSIIPISIWNLYY